MALALETNSIRVFVLDEADEMLSRGFKDQIYDVFRNLPTEVQVILLSATMPSDVMEVTQHFMRSPIRILVKKEKDPWRGSTPSPEQKRNVNVAGNSITSPTATASWSSPTSRIGKTWSEITIFVFAVSARGI